MTGSLTTYARNRAVNAGVGNQEAATSAMYIALATALPTGPGTAALSSFVAHEVFTAGSAGYGRQAITWNSASGGTVTNSGTLLFGPFTSDPANVPYIFECDTSTGSTGNTIAYWTLGTALDAASGDYIQFSPGDITMAVDACP